MFARTMTSNAAAVRVMEKCGLKFLRTYSEPEFPEGQRDAVLYVRADPAVIGRTLQVRPWRSEGF